MNSIDSLGGLALMGALLLPATGEAQRSAAAPVATISKAGERVVLRRSVVPGKHTVFEFYADW